MTTTRRSHADCTHPSTPAARAACRKGLAVTDVQRIARSSTLAAKANAETIDYSAFAYEFDTETCFRCSGTGTYPSAAWNGVCLGCNGKGKSLTRAGKAAKKAHDAWIADHLMIAVTDVQPGMKIRPTAVDSWKTVVSVEGIRINGYSITKDDEGNEIRTPLEHFEYTTKNCSWSAFPETTVQRAATPEERNALMAHLNGRKGFVLIPR